MHRGNNTAQFVDKAYEGTTDAGAEVVDSIYRLNLCGCIDCDDCGEVMSIAIRVTCGTPSRISSLLLTQC